MPVDLRIANPGDTLILKNGHKATVTRAAGDPGWSPGSSHCIRAIYHHPTDDGWDGAEGDWDADGTKHCPGKWPVDADVARLVYTYP